jgi:hypothetical protein
VAPPGLNASIRKQTHHVSRTFEQGDYGQHTIDASYSHSIVGAIVISSIVFWLGKRFLKSGAHTWLLAGLSFSHWPIDLLVHHEDLPIRDPHRRLRLADLGLSRANEVLCGKVSDAAALAARVSA